MSELVGVPGLTLVRKSSPGFLEAAARSRWLLGQVSLSSASVLLAQKKTTQKTPSQSASVSSRHISSQPNFLSLLDLALIFPRLSVQIHFMPNGGQFDTLKLSFVYPFQGEEQCFVKLMDVDDFLDWSTFHKTYYKGSLGNLTQTWELKHDDMYRFDGKLFVLDQGWGKMA